MLSRLIAGTAAIVTLAAAASPAAAERGRLADFTIGFTTQAPGAPTGLAVHVLFHRAGDPAAKPAPLRSAVIRGPSGLRFDTRTLEQCTASDADIQARGSDACPSATRLTVGSFSAVTGLGPPFDPLVGDDHVFNGAGQLIEIITVPGGTASPAFDRLTIDGAKLTAHPPKAPGGPPDGETAVRSLNFRIPPRAARGRSLITTSPSCPADGQWVTTATFGFGDGSSDTVASRTPCAHSGARGGPRRRQRLRLAVRPRHAAVGPQTRLRFRVTASERSCVPRATVRVAGRRVRTDRRGRASLVIRFGRSGRRHARVTHAGCRAGSAVIRVS